MSAQPVRLLSTVVNSDPDVLLVRQSARHIAARLGFGARDQTHIAIAVSQIAAYGVKHNGGGKVEFWVEDRIQEPMLVIRIRYDGPEISALSGQEKTPTAAKILPAAGIPGASRWMDHYEITPPGGQDTIIELGKKIPAGATPVKPQDLAGELAVLPPEGPVQEIQWLDEEILRTMEELLGMGSEIQDTNRGVVALYAELEEHAERLREAKAAVAAAANQWQTTFDAIGDGIALLDTGGNILRCNQAFTALVGKPKCEIEGQGSGELIFSMPDFIAGCLDSARRKVHREMEEVQLADGRWLNVTVDPLLDESGQITGYVSVSQDITLRKRAETELQAYATRLERSNRELQDFANIASHDLQEPLRKVRSFGDLLKQKMDYRLNDQERDYLERMQNAAARMQRMIEDLLAYARVTTRAQPHRPVDLAKVVAEVLSDLEVRMIQTEGKVVVGDLPVIQADPLQMHQLFQNLIGNALKFHKKNVPPYIKVQSKLIAGKQVEITVEDNGIGFSMENSGFLFQPFRRLHGRSEFEGSGIGLSICRKIVEGHGGKISAWSEPEKGSIFTVVLPA